MHPVLDDWSITFNPTSVPFDEVETLTISPSYDTEYLANSTIEALDVLVLEE
jgi:hypothetical protein